MLSETTVRLQLTTTFAIRPKGARRENQNFPKTVEGKNKSKQNSGIHDEFVRASNLLGFKLRVRIGTQLLWIGVSLATRQFVRHFAKRCLVDFMFTEVIPSY